MSYHGVKEEDFETPKTQKMPDYYKPKHPPLTDEETTQAVEDLVVYPKVVRKNADPSMTGQRLGCISFQLLKTPGKMSNGKQCYGFFKLRGNFSSDEEANNHMENIIRTVDSKNKIYASLVGQWYPILEESAMDDIVKDKLDVKMKKDEDNELHFRDRAEKEKYQENLRIQREIREREEEVKSGDIYDDQESLDFYTMKRVTEMMLTEAREHQRVKMESIEKNLLDTRTILKKLETGHSDYREKWIECYDAERAKTGIPAFKPDTNQFDEYEEFVNKE